MHSAYNASPVEGRSSADIVPGLGQNTSFDRTIYDNICWRVISVSSGCVIFLHVDLH